MLTICKESGWPKDFIHFGAAAGFFTSMNYLTVLQGSFSAKDFSCSNFHVLFKMSDSAKYSLLSQVI
jgi:hypothetical protein